MQVIHGLNNTALLIDTMQWLPQDILVSTPPDTPNIYSLSALWLILLHLIGYKDIKLNPESECTIT